MHTYVRPYYERAGITLYCAPWQAVLPLAEPADVVVTDPPYGIAYQSNQRRTAGKFSPIAGDKSVDASFIAAAAASLHFGGAAYVATRWDVWPQWQSAVAQHLQVKNCLVWHKPGGGMGDTAGNYAPSHEFLIYATKGRHLLRGRRIGNVWTIKKDPVRTYQHPTQKPVALMGQMIEKSSDFAELVLDPFAGSGATLVAAARLGRRAIGIELEEKYCAVAAARIDAAIDDAYRQVHPPLAAA